ncbi:MAG: hypothetical protein LBE14_06960, partial [Treponema sp.]|nr:hypothetical protein [Treponema sp.]
SGSFVDPGWASETGLGGGFGGDNWDIDDDGWDIDGDDNGSGGGIPATLAGSWGKDGVQLFKINADGTGLWGNNNLYPSSSCTWRVSGDTLTLGMYNTTGSVKWSVSNNKLTLKEPAEGILAGTLQFLIPQSPFDKLD